MSLVFLISLRLLSWKDIEFCLRLFQHLMGWSCFFFFQFVYMVDYFDRFSYGEPYLNLWNETNLIMVDDLFDCFGFCLWVFYWVFLHLCSWGTLVCNFLCWVFVCFGCQGGCAFIKWIWQCSFYFYFVEFFFSFSRQGFSE